LDIQKDLGKFEMRKERHIQKYGAPASIVEEKRPQGHTPTREEDQQVEEESRAEAGEDPDIPMKEAAEHGSPSPPPPETDKREEEKIKGPDTKDQHHHNQHHRHDESGDVVDETGEDVVIY
jgi:hypothetical protein